MFIRLLLLLCLLPLSIHRLGAQCGVTVSAGDDLYLCQLPTPAQLQGEIIGDYLNFFWTPTTGLSGANTLTPTANVQQTTTYTLTARVPDLSNNLILNGDFELGNTGFYSDYVYNPGDLVPEGVYDVLPNPQASHPGFAPCPDHTSGSGNMMAVNGAGMPNQNVWCQTVSVMPNTTYVFSAWVTTLVATSPALLQFSINGVTIPPIFSAPSSTCNWINFFTTWNSGANTSATICVVNQNTVLGGNDFALDDMVFAPTCLVSDSVTVHVVPVVAVATPPNSNIPCEGYEITLNGTGSTTGPNVTYEWSTPNGNIVSGENTLNPVVDAAGQYTLTVSVDNNGVICEKTANVNVIVSNALLAWISNPQPLGCGADSVILAGNSTQGPQSAYQWSTVDGNIVSGADTRYAVVDAPGTYSLLVTNTVTGCTATAEVVLTVANNPPTALAQTVDSISCYTPTAIVSGAGSSTGPNIQYAWTASAGGVILGGQNSIQATAGAPGTYILAVTNTTNNCTTLDTVALSGDLSVPALSIALPDTLNCTFDTLALSASLTPASAPFVWSTTGGNFISGDTTLNPLIDAAGLYIFTATNLSSGCSSADTVQVVIDTVGPLAVVLPADTITCQDPEVSLSGAGSSTGAAFDYLWTTNGGNIVSGETTLTPVVNAPGWYQLAVLNTTNGCVAFDSIQAPADTNALTAIASAPDTLSCVTDSVQISSAGSSQGAGLLFNWTTGNGLILSGAQTPTPTAGLPGVYALQIVNPANGCTASDTTTVAINNAPPQLGIDSAALLTCVQPVVQLNAQNGLPGPHTYGWTTAGGNILAGADGLQPTVDQPGWYFLLATNLENGCTDLDSVVVQQSADTPLAVASVQDTLTCTVPSLTLSGAGSSSGPSFVLLWTAMPGGNIVSGAQTGSPVVDAPGIYVLSVTNTSNGCTVTDSVAVEENVLFPPAVIEPALVLTCNLPSQLLTANAGVPDSVYTYAWFFNSQTISATDTAPATVEGWYSVLVTDPTNNCTRTDSVFVQADQAPPLLTPGTPATLNCLTMSTVLPMGFSPAGLLFDWQTADGQFVSSPLVAQPEVDAPGVYTLVATNPQNGCSADAQVLVGQDTVPPALDAGPAAVLTCVITQTSLQGTAAPGTTVVWSTPSGNILSGDLTLTPAVNAPGVYLLTGTNPANGCQSEDSVTIAQNIQTPAVTAGADDTLSCSLTSLQLLGSTAPTNLVLWTAQQGGNIIGGENTLSPVIDAPGLYVLLVTDPANGCVSSDSLSIYADADAPTLQMGAPPLLTCAMQQAGLSATGSTGPSFMYQWSTVNGQILSGGQTLTPVIGAPGAYTLTITNSNNGCTNSESVVVAADTLAPDVDAGTGQTITCSQPLAPLNGRSDTPGVQFLWSNPDGGIAGDPQQTNTLAQLPGWYTLQVTNVINGCVALDSTWVAIDTAAPLPGLQMVDVLTCAQPSVIIDASVFSPASFTTGWTTTNGNIVSGATTLNPVVDAPGDYLLTVLDNTNGCTATLPVVVQQNIAPPLAEAGAVDTVTCLITQLSLNSAGSSTGPGITYAWTASGGGQIVSGAQTATPLIGAAGQYTLLVNRADNGCSAVDSVLVVAFTTPPVVAVAVPGILNCREDTIALSATVQTPPSPNAGFQAQWTTAGGRIAGYVDPLSPLVDAPGTYQLTVARNDNGCTASSTVTVLQDIQSPNLQTGPDQLIFCTQPTAQLSVGSTTAGLSFAWTTVDGNILSGANTADPTVGTGGMYTVVATNTTNGCTGTDEVGVEEIPLPAFVPEAEQPTCLNPAGRIDFGPVTGGLSPFDYSINNGQSFSGNAAYTNLAPGVYPLVVRDALGCLAEAAVTLMAPPVAVLTIQDVYLLPLGDSVQLQPATNLSPPSALTWSWTPADGLSCADCPEPVASPAQTTRYTVMVTDAAGCSAREEVLIRVDRRRNLYAPNVIMPESATNGRFILYGKGVDIIESLQIFDRWGNLAFYATNLGIGDENSGWDGTFQSEPVNPGVFVWKARVRFVDGESEVFAGDVTVIR